MTNVAVIRWILDASNNMIDHDLDTNAPIKTAVWAVGDVLTRRWVSQEPIFYMVPDIFQRAIDIDRADDNEDSRMLRVQVAPEQKTASFVKVPSAKCVVNSASPVLGIFSLSLTCTEQTIWPFTARVGFEQEL
ncbi:hypothetical protein GCG54_00007395 [Colletotrichum gloeosporioides]|uniref:Uncharacterized protein n=1 Tax=Colletotrichum gloeosporioides TaxID=474922 RepID=A0A8H4FMK1_COLGL|nr:uncharacterized protein GCG54_00007395 [Colletotrichum gloeosporioides]KAF3807662.1 hypothetical protein GCG54_00007395 [Colletotrichum gloeosporioides]